MGVIVKNKWLNNFDSHKWRSVIPGRLGLLSLKGKLGNLCIAVVYMTTGEDADLEDGSKIRPKEERRIIRTTLGDKLPNRNAAMSLVMGDLDTASEPEGRTHIGPMTFTGGGDAGEETHWQEVVSKPNGLYEMCQPEHTNKHSTGTGRIDRVYTNQPVADQLDKRTGCVALSWTHALSTHRPVACVRTEKPVGGAYAQCPIETGGCAH